MNPPHTTDSIAPSGHGGYDGYDDPGAEGGRPGSHRDRRRSAIGLLAAAITVQTMTAPGQTVGVAVFVDHLVADLDITRSTVSTAYLVGTLAGAVSMPAAGRFIDRRGVRSAIRIFTIGFGLALLAMSGVVGVITLTLGFGITRALGQGALTLAATTSIAVGFDGKRGTAMGIKTALSAGLMSLVPIVGTVLIMAVGWRMTWMILAVGVWVIVLPITATGVLTRRPSGAFVPDAVEQPSGANPTGRASRGNQPSTSAALRTWQFWSITATVSASALVGTGLVFHHVSLLAERGLSPAAAAANFLPQTVAGALAALAAGRLADRASPTVLLTLCTTLLAIVPFVVQYVHPGWSVIAYGVGVGSASAAIRAVEATVTPRWFGTAAIGELRGIVMAASVAASAVGPLVLAISVDHLGGYRPGLLLFSVIGAVLAVVCAFTRPPRLELR